MMAAKLLTDQDRPKSTASNVYTLPLSCQICLGKVRQPVLCSNFHVFCRACIDTWLERSQRCPSCRVLIDQTNPVKQIRGGLNQVDDEDRERGTPELRKTRFDLLYKDYEDTLAQLEREVKQLRHENACLKSQLAVGRGGSSSGSVGGKEHGAGAGSSEQQLQLLTAKLQDAQKLYNRVKQDISRLKKENHSLKEGHANLTHENAKLREEISSRSPHKFGRLTVATLESQLDIQRKEVQRLTRALERSDQYIETLQEQQEKLEKLVPSNIHRDTRSTGGSSKAPDSALPVKRQLFPKELEVNCVDGQGQPRSSSADGRISERLPSPRSAKAFSAKSEDALDSIMRKSEPTSKVDSKREKSPAKKVHFSVTEKKSNDSSSFTLEVPSPIVASLSTDCSQSSDKLPAGRNDTEHGDKSSLKNSRPPASSDWVDAAGDWDFKMDQRHDIENDLSSRKVSSYSSSKKEESLSSWLKQRYNDRVSRKDSQDPNGSSNLSEPECNTPPSLNELDSGKSVTLKKKGAHSKDTVERGTYSGRQGTNVSFNLEEPSLDDTQTIQTELKDLDISVTPELSDCLKLLNRAEKKVSQAEPPYLAVQAGTMTSGNSACVPSSSTVWQQGSVGRQYSSLLPATAQHLSTQGALGKGGAHLGLESASGYPVSSGTSGLPGTYIPGTTGVMSSWEHGFFSSLRVNPYKHAAPHTHIPTSGQKQIYFSEAMSQPVDVGPFSGQSRKELPSWTSSLPLNSKASAVTEVKNHQFSHSSAVPSSAKFLSSGAHSNMTKSLSAEHLFVLPSSKAASSDDLVPGPRSSLSSKYPGDTAFSSDGRRSVEPVSSLTSSVYPLNIASSSGFSQHQPHVSESHGYWNPSHVSESQGYRNPSHVSESQGYRNPCHVSALPQGEPVPNLTSAVAGEGSYLFTEKRATNNYSYVSNASSQGGEHTTSNHNDSFLPEPKKRLFDFDSEEESDFGTPSKTTKIL